MNNLDKQYDVIILGTGLVESIVAAAVARAGKTVLHIDSNAYYGGYYSVHNLQSIESWIAKQKAQQLQKRTISSEDVEIDNGEALVKLNSDGYGVDGVHFSELNCSRNEEDQCSTIHAENCSLNTLGSSYKQFNIDLFPSILYANGMLVKLLISSDVAKYCEFKLVSRILAWNGHALEQVPCSKADVFSNNLVSVVEKRQMMKFLAFCQNYDNNTEDYINQAKPFSAFIRTKQLTERTSRYIQNCMALSEKCTTTEEGLESVKLFVSSIGTYGNTAFLWPMYGAGELAQCFCRMCAVFGGVYNLDKMASYAIIKESKATGLILDTGERISCNAIVANVGFSGNLLDVDLDFTVIHRAILITDRSIYEGGTENISFLNFPVRDQNVYIYEVSSNASVCPAGLFLVHLTCECPVDEECAISSVIESLFTNLQNKPRIVWQLTFSIQKKSKEDYSNRKYENVFFTSGLTARPGTKQIVEEARAIFNVICPGDEFLPQPPRYEDIL